MRGFSYTLVALLCATALSHAIDFSPQYADSVQDGFPVRRLYFADKDQHIYLAIPKDWNVSGNGQRAIFTPPALLQATVTLENAGKARAFFDDKGLEFYRKTATALVPSGAIAVEVAFEKVNGMAINGWSSFEMGFTYQLYGQNFARSILFLTLDPEQQLQLRIEAPRERFETVSGQAHGIVSSWFAPPPKVEEALARLSQRH